MRKAIKTASSALEKFIPKNHAEDTSLSEDAKEIKDRPMVFMVRKLTREDRYNLRSLSETEMREVDGKVREVPVNFGSLALFIWENCVIEARNVLLDDKEHDVLVGREKNELFKVSGIDQEILEAIDHVQRISSFDEEEVKN